VIGRAPSTSIKKSFRRTYRRLFKKNRARVARYSIIGANMALLGFVAFFVTNNPDSGSAVRQNAVAGNAMTAEASPLDQLSSADIAVHASRMTNLPEAVAVTNQADSEATQLAITATENKVVAKPQIVTTSLKSAKDIKTYTTVAGDTIAGLATKFGITSDSIRWSNSLTREQIDAGKALVIPPVTGIVYTVKSGDTADTLAQRYAASKDQILSDNDSEVTGLKVGQRILIRGGVQPVARTAVASRSTGTTVGGFSFGTRAIFGYNGYDYGYCTWYAANKRAALGRPVPANLGDAWTWDDRAATAGFTVNRTPAYGAVAVTDSYRRPGHVAIVEEVYPDGSIKVSEMNVRGWGVMSTRVFDAGRAASFNYIH
jgi:N-acetylmuramoyl-L-alanine amidase